MDKTSLIRKAVRQLAAYTPGEQPREKDIVKLNTNENPYPPSPAVADAYRASDPNVLRLYPDPVCTALRTRVAELCGCGMESVFVGNGSDEILALATRAFVEDEGSIGYFDPSYSLYPVLADMRVVEKRPVALGPDFDWAMPAGYSSSLFLLANPNAPTSVQYPRETVAAFCAAFPGVVLIDEAYVDFAEYHCADLARTLDNVLVMRTLSKSYSLAGLRLGYAVGHPALVGALMKLKDSYNVDAIAQRLALAALSDVEAMQRNVKRIQATRARMTDRLKARGWQIHPSSTNFIWARPAAMPAKAVFDKLREKRIIVRHFAGPRTGAYLRITVGTGEQAERLLQAVEAIEQEGTTA